jgi:4'-phosphopantetheinyl transferase
MNMETTGWRHAVPAGLISSNEVHVWRLFVDANSSTIESLWKVLSPDELSRAGKFHFEKDRKRFIQSRGILRTILSYHLDQKPSEICFAYTSFGKPMLVTGSAPYDISFNLSHSGDIVLYAITQHHKIGIDVERIRDLDVMQIARRFFTQGELDEIERAHERNRSELFFKYWTRKEAMIKGFGKGVSIPMEQIDVSSLNGGFLSSPKTLLANDQHPSLYVQDLFPGDGYAAAIATEEKDPDIFCWHYSA